MKRSKRLTRPSTGPGKPPLPEESHPERFRWIVDGHNAIFAVPAWERLQVAGRRREARLALEEALESFGRAIGRRIWLVYDGNRMERNPDALLLPHLQSWYSNPPEEADDRILFLVQQSLRGAERPVVVTSDRRTLADRLPAGARFLEVARFFGGVHQRALQPPEKWSPGGMHDIEEHFLRLSGEETTPARGGEEPPEDGPPGS